MSTAKDSEILLVRSGFSGHFKQCWFFGRALDTETMCWCESPSFLFLALPLDVARCSSDSERQCGDDCLSLSEQKYTITTLHAKFIALLLEEHGTDSLRMNQGIRCRSFSHHVHAHVLGA